MKRPPDFETAGSRGYYRPTGKYSAAQVADLVNDALARARSESLLELLVNISALTGFDSPGPAYRRWVGRRWARTADGRLRIAVVARQEHICPQKTGLLVAAEEGLDATISDSETEALAWLDGAAVGILPVESAPVIQKD